MILEYVIYLVVLCRPANVAEMSAGNGRYFGKLSIQLMYIALSFHYGNGEKRALGSARLL